MYKHVVLLAVCCASVIHHGLCQQEEGDFCESASGSGTCKKQTECPQIQEESRSGVKPTLCGLVGNTPVVCCPIADYDYETNLECPPIPSNASKVQKIGRKAWDKCIDYLEYVYPCKAESSLSLRQEKKRQLECFHEVTGLVVGGNDTVDREFPHMALLGFGPSESRVSWKCGGTVISKNFVMTAGHCTFARDLGRLTFVRVGMTVRSYPIDKQRIHRVAEIIKHPEYKAPSIYNDIALIKTATPITLDGRVYPACLHIGNTVNDDNMVATGWGLLNFQGTDGSDTLQKVTLEKFTSEECKDFVPPRRKHKFGLLPDSQFCAGHHTKARDTCQGDSGGPLQIYNLDVKCMYTVVGVTSFGSGCGTVSAPGVYTRVSHYISWIESIVWP